MSNAGAPLVLDARQRATRRAQDIERIVLPRVRETFARRKDLRSALFVVAQYWNDSANDELHGHIVFSSEAVPRWPHECEWPRHMRMAEPCTRCDPSGDTYFTLPYEEATFRAWEAYCKEGANQEQDLAQAYLPYAVVTKRADGSLELDVVGEPVRAWLDLPDEPSEGPADSELLELVHSSPDDPGARHVLADALLERGDPRGEYLAIVLSKAPRPDALARAEALFAEHGRGWLGPIARIAPIDATRFSLGFVDHVAAFFPSGGELSWVAGAREWSTVRSLTFLPESRQHLGPAMREIRSIGPLADEALHDLAGADHPWGFERLHIAPRHADAVALLCEPHVNAKLPRLRELVVSGILTAPVHLRNLAATPLWPRLEALHVSGMFPNPEHGLEPTLLHVWLTTDMRLPPELGLGMRGCSGEPAGAWLRLRRRAREDSRVTARMTIAELGAPYGFQHLAGAIAALEPDVRARIAEIELEPSRWLRPGAADLMLVRDMTGLPVRVV